MRAITRRTFLSGLGLAAAFPRTPAWAAARAARWRDMWDGRTLRGWQTYLRGRAGGDPPIGVDTDPNGVFSIVRMDGAPAIRISGQDWGALTTRDEHDNYHFRVAFKWGEKRWPPRERAKRDSGVLYHCVGPHGAGSRAWMRSFEIQVQEGDCGDFWSVDGVIVDVEGTPPADAPNEKKVLVYKKGAPIARGVTHRIIKASDAEKPSGEWNLIEVLAVGDTSVHVVNGTPVMTLTGLRQRQGAQEVPLTRGRIQIQSEGAEVFYRRPQIRPLRRLPA